MNAYFTKQNHPIYKYYFLSHAEMHTFPGFPQFKVKEKVWRGRHGEENVHRFYLYWHGLRQYIGDMVGDDGFVRVSNDYVYICAESGREIVKCKIK